MTVAVLLSLGAAVGYGVGDFLGGLFGRRVGIVPVLVVGQFAGLVVLGAATLALSPPPARATDLAWGALAGSFGVAGALLLLRGFRAGRMGVVSPVSSLGAAGLPVLSDVVFETPPTATALVGIAIGLAAIWLVGTGGPDALEPGRRAAAGLGYGLVAGVAFAALYLSLARTDPDSGAWPALAAQGVLVALGLVVAVARRQRPAVARRDLPGVAASGIAGALATLSFLLAARAGLVSIAAVIASLSPAVTVLLARFVLAERLSRRQLAGLAVAGLALVLIQVGG